MIPTGFTFSGVRSGLKNKRNDIGIILSDRPARAAGVFTQNLVHASSVDFTRAAIQNGYLRAVVANSGNANCCTGEQGVRDTARMAELVATALHLDPSDVGVASTGVIGQHLDMPKVELGIPDAATKLGPMPKAFMEAILTTDLVEKWALKIAGDKELYSPASPAQPPAGAGVIYGVAKGSGMIAPNMGTMLAFITSDYDVDGLDIDAILRRAVDQSFNRLTVDGDTSTNDTLLLLANGASGVKPTEEEFEAALTEVCVSLARQVARDGEGATKLVEVRVTGSEDPYRVARVIAESPLVKTAMFGCDPNWGRILAAAGRSGVAFNVPDAKLHILARDESFLLFENSTPAAFDPKVVSAALKSDQVIIDLFLGEGETAVVYTCDFGYGYVRINAEYHT